MIDIEPPSHESDDGSPQRHGTVVEGGLIVLISLAMILLPVLEIVLRWFKKDLPGESVYVQRLTLWLGFLGALGATAAGKHLGLATTNFLREGRRKTAALVFSSVVSSAVSMMLTYASALSINENRASPNVLAGGIPDWWSEVIVPIAFLAITLRFIWKTPGKWRGRALSLAVCLVLALLFYFFGENHASAFLWPLLVAILTAFAVGAPVFIIMSGVAMLLFFVGGTPIATVPTNTLQLVENETLPAIPLLTLAGYVLASGGAGARMVRAYKSLFGWLPGGVALMVVGVCALFTTFTGGSGVTILALGGLVYPALKNDKYPDGFSLGLVTASGSLGLLFPPSLPVILYGAVAHVSAQKLFQGGLAPGLLLILMVAAYSIAAGVRAQAPRQKFDWRELLKAGWAAKWDLGLPLLVLFVFQTGRATIVEAAALGAAYALAVELLVFRDIHPVREMPRVMVQSATLVGAVVILLGVALGFTAWLVDAQIPDALIAWVQAHIHSQWVFLLALNALLLVLGSVFEIYAAIIVLAPLVAPLGALFGVEPVHLGVVFLANLELGFLFPPMGLNLFLSASRFNKPLPYLYKQALPFLIILAIGVLIITYVPAMTTGMVKLLAH